MRLFYYDVQYFSTPLWNAWCNVQEERLRIRDRGAVREEYKGGVLKGERNTGASAYDTESSSGGYKHTSHGTMNTGTINTVYPPSNSQAAASRPMNHHHYSGAASSSSSHDVEPKHIPHSNNKPKGSLLQQPRVRHRGLPRPGSSRCVMVVFHTLYEHNQKRSFSHVFLTSNNLSKYYIC